MERRGGGGRFGFQVCGEEEQDAGADAEDVDRGCEGRGARGESGPRLWGQQRGEWIRRRGRDRRGARHG